MRFKHVNGNLVAFDRAKFYLNKYDLNSDYAVVMDFMENVLSEQVRFKQYSPTPCPAWPISFYLNKCDLNLFQELQKIKSLMVLSEQVRFKLANQVVDYGVQPSFI